MIKKLNFITLLLLLLLQASVLYSAWNSLGAIVSENSTIFKIWSPDTDNVKLYVQESSDGNFKEYSLTKEASFKDNGGFEYTDVYSTIINKNLNLSEYYFSINGKQVRDPYAKMVAGENSSFVNKGTLESPIPTTAPNPGPAIQAPRNGVAIDFTKLKYQFAEPPPLTNLTDAIIYETHIADFTSNPNSGVENPGTFAGMVQSGKCNKQSTGLQHLIDLGITHVQIMPMFSFSYSGYSYNWGYGPLNYNVPQQKYSMYSASSYIKRLQELQKMVDTFHQNGIRVIMDVVFNHTYTPIYQDITSQYYLTDSSGNLIDDTGCGNTVNTANPMVSNMVRDSLDYWMKVFNIDGYRFDEMGCFDYTTVSSWAQYLNKIYPGRKFLYYGEPWNGGNTISEKSCREGNISCSEYMSESALTYGVGCFNGAYRVALKGNDGKTGGGGGYLFNQSVNNPSNPIGKDTIQNIAYGFNGSIRAFHTSNSVPEALKNPWWNAFANMPSEPINYVSCHDNLCLWDKICAVTGQNNWSDQYNRQIDMFCQGILMTSQAIPFFLQGDEFLRTKDGNANSYNAPLTINWIDWSLKSQKYNNQVFQYYKKMIELRKNHPALRMSTWNNINKCVESYTESNSNTPAGVLIGVIKNAPNDSCKNIIVIYNCGNNYDYTLPALPKGYLWKVVTNINDVLADPDTKTFPAVYSNLNPGDSITCGGTSVTVLTGVSAEGEL